MYIQSHYERKIRSLESRIDFLEHEVKYISDFITWIDSEPPIGRCEECDLWCEEQGICTAASDDDIGIYEYTEPDHFCGYFKQKDGEEK